MSIPFYLPPVRYERSLAFKRPVSVRELCAAAGIPCRATGPFTDREIEIGQGRELVIEAEPGSWGRVRIVLKGGSERRLAREALQVLAYGLHDLVAKESIRGMPWAKPSKPTGRPRTIRPLSNKERQRRFREKQRG